MEGKIVSFCSLKLNNNYGMQSIKRKDRVMDEKRLIYTDL